MDATKAYLLANCDEANRELLQDKLPDNGTFSFFEWNTDTLTITHIYTEERYEGATTTVSDPVIRDLTDGNLLAIVRADGPDTKEKAQTPIGTKEAIETIQAAIEADYNSFGEQSEGRAQGHQALDILTETIAKLDKRNSDLEDAYSRAYDFLSERDALIDDPDDNDE